MLCCQGQTLIQAWLITFQNSYITSLVIGKIVFDGRIYSLDKNLTDKVSMKN